jgi:hypothetical protein
MAPIYLIAYESSRIFQTRQFRVALDRVARLVLGGVLGLAVYFILHPDTLTLLAKSSNSARWDYNSIHFLSGYFFSQRLYRHLLELAIFAACLFVHIRRRDYVQWPFPIIASLATFMVGFLLPHGNMYYTPFWYFPSFLLVFLTIRVAWRPVVLPALVLVLFVPQYAVAYDWAHKYSAQSELQVARWAIASRGTDLSHAHIFGDFIFWPMFKDLSFEWSPLFSSYYHRNVHDTIYLICGLDTPFSPQESTCADELPASSNMQLIDQFLWAGRQYLVYERRE